VGNADPSQLPREDPRDPRDYPETKKEGPLVGVPTKLTRQHSEEVMPRSEKNDTIGSLRREEVMRRLARPKKVIA